MRVPHIIACFHRNVCVARVDSQETDSEMVFTVWGCLLEFLWMNTHGEGEGKGNVKGKSLAVTTVSD